jgi:hypothetical protein
MVEAPSRLKIYPLLLITYFFLGELKKRERKGGQEKGKKRREYVNM